MLTDVIHNVPRSAMNMPFWIDLIVQQMRTFNGFHRDFLSNMEENKFWIGFMGWRELLSVSKSLYENYSHKAVATQVSNRFTTALSLV